ncbi:hypothetical protein NDN08_003426 [Rhodosorus marinus]|uniref:Smr domain-containing protein n=1 Tax=Rhodosorus marinus TaxID=101924 RepID=A0AAV8UZA9_9RHOD|nr:hypothetical protein NDN08_003426 [Rhodosorus marinus]
MTSFVAAGVIGRVRGSSALCTTRAGDKRVRRAPVAGLGVQSNKPDTDPEEQVLDVEIESLNLLDWPEITKNVSRFACTDCGREVLAINMPLAESVEEAELLLLETHEATLIENSDLCLDFSGAGEIERYAQLASRGSSLSGTELARIADTLRSMRKNKRAIEDFADSEELIALVEVVADLSTKAELEREIRRCIDGEGRVLDSASRELCDLRNDAKDVQALIMTSLNETMARKRDALQDRIVTTRYDRFVLTVKASQKSKVPGVVHDSSSSGQTLYIEPKEVKEQNDRMRVLARKEQALVEKVLSDLSALVGNEADDLESVQYALTRLDLAQARARHSIALNAVQPKFSSGSSDEGYVLDLRGARHPLLLWQKRNSSEPGSDIDEVIPSDYKLFNGTKCAILTGPNTGGKTVCLKNLGAAVLMARAGLFVCAEKARFPFFDKVLADIGDDQSIVQSLSTFSGHVQRLKRILQSATPKSLVLLDEVGSGTDPAEGSALGMSLLQKLSNTVQLVMATTHHGELKTLKYADDKGRFENASVQFDDEKMRPTYKLIWGIPGRSNALSIASRLGLSKEIIDCAEDYLSGSSNKDVNMVIAALEKQRAELEELNKRLSEKEAEAEQAAKTWQEKVMAFEQEEKSERRRLRADLEKEFEAAKGEVRDVVRSMQKAGLSSKSANSARDQLVEMSDRLSKKTEGNKKNGFYEADNVKEGDLVCVERLGDSPVKVVEPPGPKGDVTVMLGQMKMKVKLEELLPVTSNNPSSAPGGLSARRSPAPAGFKRHRGSKKAAGKVSLVHVKTASNTVDIRGKRVDEALDSVREAINGAFGFGTMWIVHGHGTGALRQSVREMLKRSKLVQKFEDADRLDGGSGATVVYFK